MNLFYFCFGILLYAPFLILFSNHERNLFSFVDVWFPACICICALIVSVLVSKNKNVIINQLNSFFGAMSLYILISINIYPFQSGPLDGHVIHLNKVSFFGHIVLAVICLIISIFYKSILNKLLNVIGIVSILFFVFICFNTPTDKKKDVTSLISIGKTNNVFIIVMDMFQGYFARTCITGNPELEKKFSGFICFDNAISAAPYTASSTRYILLGTQPQNDTGRFVEINEKNNLFSDAIKKGYFTSYAYIPLPPKTDNLNTYFAMNLGVKKIEYWSFVYICIARYYPSRLIPQLGSDLEFGWISKENAKESFKWFVNNLVVSDTHDKTFHYYHNIMTHQPVRFNANGEYSKKLTADDVYGEIEYGFKSLGFFIDRLKELDVYNNSTIIITGDHGYNILNSFSKKTLPIEANYLLDRIANTQRGQYDVALLIKPPNAHGSMQRSNSAVILSDLRKTVNELMVPGSGRIFEGVNMLDSAIPSERKVKILTYVGEKLDNTGYERFDFWKVKEFNLVPSKICQSKNK